MADTSGKGIHRAEEKGLSCPVWSRKLLNLDTTSSIERADSEGSSLSVAEAIKVIKMSSEAKL